jgi:C_GCAxxG_C_C family probable redox protein
VSSPRPIDAGEESVATLIAERARNLFATRQMHCSEAVLVTLNRSLQGGLETRQALALAGPFAEGVGGTGCMCGAVGGALMALGLFIGGAQPLRRRLKVRQATELLMAEFKRRAGTPCCRLLSRRLPAGATRHDHCAELTATAAALAAERILDHNPELANVLDVAFVTARDSLPKGVIKRLLRCAGCSW